jgi:hypothetical protein
MDEHVACLPLWDVNKATLHLNPASTFTGLVGHHRREPPPTVFFSSGEDQYAEDLVPGFSVLPATLY